MRYFNISGPCNNVKHYMIEAIISGKDIIDTVSDDFLHLKDLGLIRTDNQRIELSNPIYVEAIVRKLSAMTQRKFKQTEY